MYIFLRIQLERLKIVLRGGRVREAKYINIGAGPNFPASREWIILEELVSYNNPFSFILSKDCVFPVQSNSIELVYTSHCLEHLDDVTVARILTESRRVLKDKGLFLVKIPDFEAALNTWRECGESIIDNFYDERTLSTWRNKNIEKTPLNKLSMLFCGFSNDAFGGQYSNNNKMLVNAYHGPAPVKEAELDDLLRNHSPHEISAALKNKVLDNEVSFHLNHQNAWSCNELKIVLEQYDFMPITFCKKEIINKFIFIPGIDTMESNSMYCLAMTTKMGNRI